MSENLELEKQLKLVAKTGSYIVGRREVSSSLKGAKLLVWSASANVPQLILDECKNLSVPAIKFAGNPVELGRACGIPFRVSVIALKSTGDADLSRFANSSDYYTGVTVVPSGQQQELLESKRAKGEVEPKPKKETKKKEIAKHEKPKKVRKSEDEKEADKKARKKTDSEKTASSKKETAEAKKEKKTTRKKKKPEVEEEEE